MASLVCCWPCSPKVAGSTPARGRGSLVVKVSDRGWLVTSSSPVPLKSRRAGKQCTSNLSRAQTSSRWSGGKNLEGSKLTKNSDQSPSHQNGRQVANLIAKIQLNHIITLFDGYKECTRVAVLHKCSPEAADLGEQIVTKAGGPLVQTHCANFKHNTPDCAFHASSAISKMPLPVLFLTCFLLLFLSMFSYR
ncbi:uncharacterized protein TNCV_2616411 [Trichonephila clavipes]|nr:uncharacterized protein TNCV_2616411 [Trichonephila clavipes]